MTRTASRTAAMIGALLLASFGCAQTDETTLEDAPAAAESASTDGAVVEGGLLNPNRASAEELAGLPHLDAAAAATIVDGRPFLGMESLHAGLVARGLGEDELTELYGRMFVPVNLNEASAGEIQLIPGVGARMLHEFEEYRPYVGMAQFRREIGKYVDDSELARLARYVFVPIDLNTASDEDILAIPGVGERMLHEFQEYRPYSSLEQFRREIGKYVDEGEVARLERYVTIR